MIEVILLLLPIFTMIGIGFLFVQRGWFPADGLAALNKFVMNACPWFGKLLRFGAKMAFKPNSLPILDA